MHNDGKMQQVEDYTLLNAYFDGFVKEKEKTNENVAPDASPAAGHDHA
jgi:hypothetical protein